MTEKPFNLEAPDLDTEAIMREIRARSEDDLIVALSLYRPGPIGGGLKDAFVRRFKGLEAVEHLHPALAPILDETHGVILYQEQVLRIAHDLAGFSLAEADMLRRGMSHFDPGRQMQKLEKRFVDMAVEKTGMPKETGERLWEMMAAFAGYGFPKAHAASYARVAWRSAWCKTHFPAEFMAAVLANQGGYYSQRVYLNEARRLGLEIRPPHVVHSRQNFAAVPVDGSKVLYMGLDQVNSLTRHTIKRIIGSRPFHSLDDFLARVDPRPQEAANLVRVGAFAGMGSIPVLLDRLARGGWQARQPGLFDVIAGEATPARLYDEDWTIEQKVAAQKELLGIPLEAHPLELAASRISEAGAIPTVEAAGLVGQKVTVAGIRQGSHRSKTSRGETMMFLTLEDLVGTLDIILFPNVYRKVSSFIYTPDPLLVTGTVEMDQDSMEPFLRAELVLKL